MNYQPSRDGLTVYKLNPYKPIVYYRPRKDDHIQLGQRALVYPVNHTSPLVSNKSIALTSKVIKIFNEGFETKNSIYRQFKGETK